MIYLEQKVLSAATFFSRYVHSLFRCLCAITLNAYVMRTTFLFFHLGCRVSWCIGVDSAALMAPACCAPLALQQVITRVTTSHTMRVRSLLLSPSMAVLLQRM